ncbi:sensor histidine kinase [Microbacterium terricola]|uniref:histidine kinase n=1 Tax=Microbacterium terricola TaxID=344163 RepID=A0ABM8DVI0_9MICO|nr:histidine kinase [Microbacterium terricola]UYK39589.1 histidine kinase [Microbacterium terricola]BDV29674.1 two-component sensor histidine kinase [Microbacterium terricola]
MFRPLKTYQLVIDLVVAVVFFCAAGLLAGAATGSRTDLLIALMMAAALAVRRLSPPLSLGIAWAGAIAQMLIGLDPIASNLAIFAVLFATAAYGTRTVFWAGFASAIVGAIVITLYLLRWRVSVTGLSWDAVPAAAATLIAALFALLLSWTAGALVRAGMRTRETRAAQVQAEAETVAEQERVRIARDMHDVVAHSLAVVIAQADGARYAAAADPAVAADALATISTTARAALADVRLLLTQLRHAQSEGPQPTLADLEALYAQVRAAGVDLRVDVDPAPAGDPPAAVQLAAYRILQEALTNALRHGDGAAVDVTLSWLPDRVELSVRNGIGDRAATDGPRGGHGLIGMRERAQLAGGTLEAGAHDDAFVVRATIPIAGAIR